MSARGVWPAAATALVALLLQVAAVAAVVSGPWSGGVTAREAVVVARLENAEAAWLEVSESADFATARRVNAQPSHPAQLTAVMRFAIEGLQPATRYHFRVRTADEAASRAATGTFVTFPAEGERASFRFAFASCARTGSTHPVFTRIAREEPLFFLHTGDLHYEDIELDDPEAFRAAYDATLRSQTQGALYRQVPIAYTWDDHDFGPNGSDRHSPSRLASLATYREYVPHYPLAWDEERKVALNMRADGPITQAFSVGRVRFLVLDTRSERDSEKLPDGPNKTMLGTWQKEWLKRELLAAQGRYPLVFIVSSVAWISNETTRRDNWGRFIHERAELSEWMVEQGIRGVCFLGGDAHMLAADDGRNNAYARNGGPNFPALHAAPLDRGGSIKGGPWSVAPVLPEQGEGQFGVVDVTDRGESIDVLFRGLNHAGREKLRLEFSVTVP